MSDDSHKDLSSYFNSILKRKRLKIEKIHNSLKIPKKFLIYLQNGEYEKFPPSVYVKGYLKEIAKFLKIDEKEIISLYTTIKNNIDNDQKPTPKYEPILNIHEEKSKSWKFFLIFGIISILIVIIILFSNIKPFNKKTNLQKKLKSHSIKKSENKFNKNIIKEKDNQNDNISTNTKELFKLNTETQKIKQKNKIKKNILHYIKIIAKDKTWLKISVDNETTKDLILYEKQHIILKAKKIIEMKVGNAAGIKLEVDNKTYPFYGKKGEVKNLLIKF